MNAQASPNRTCAACRKTRPAHELVRFARVDTPTSLTVAVDLARLLPGRGVHLCADPRCLQRAVKGSAFKRGFRASVTLPTEPYEGLCSLVVEALTAAARELLLHGERVAASGHATVDVGETAATHGWLTSESAGTALDSSDTVQRGRPRVARRHQKRLSWLSAGHSRFTFAGAGDMNRRPAATKR